MNIVSAIFEQHHDEAPALIHDGGTVSYRELNRRVRHISHGLKTHALWPRSGIPRVALSFPSGPGYIALALAILDAGGCFLPVPDELTQPERDQLLRITAADLLISEEPAPHPSPLPELSQDAGASPSRGEGASISASGFLPLPASSIVSAQNNLRGEGWGEGDELPLSRGVIGRVQCQITALHHNTPPEFPIAALNALNPAFIRFSSGTTGRAKGVVLSHESLLDRITAANQVLRIGCGDRVLWMLPMAHHFAVSIVLYLYHGAVTVLASSSDLLTPARDHRVTVIYGSPYHFAMLAAEPGAAPWPGLRLAVSTAFALPESTAQLFFDKFHLPLRQGLGIIEAGLPMLNVDAAKSKPCSIGKPTPSFAARLDEETGELFLDGPGMLDAYLSPWQTREDILQDDWFATGDIAERDADGCYFLRGRTRSVINVGGMKCFPEEVEAVLRLHPSVAAARVVAREHPGLGASPVAEIVLADHAHPPPVIELRKHCQQQLAAYKIPLAFQFVEVLPLTSSGKILRAQE